MKTQTTQTHNLSPAKIEADLRKRVRELAKKYKQPARLYRSTVGYDWPMPGGSGIGILTLHVTYFVKMAKHEAPREAEMILESVPL